MADNCMRPSETEEKKYHHNVAIAAVFDSVYGTFISLQRLHKLKRKVLVYVLTYEI